MSSLFDLSNRTALVTGACGGLGTAIAEAFAAHGATLILSDYDNERCAALAAQLAERGAAVHAIAADLANAASIDALAAAALERCGHIDVLVCNAGIQGPAGPIGRITDDDWERVMAVNLRSAMRLTAHIIPRMAERRDGSVILMSSIAGLRGNKSIGLYGLSKAALAELARNLAVEWGPTGVRVNAIAPGVIRTPLAERLLADAAFMERRLAMTPLRRVGEPHEVAGVATMLASAAGGFITGQTIVVDGGTLIGDGG